MFTTRMPRGSGYPRGPRPIRRNATGAKVSPLDLLATAAKAGAMPLLVAAAFAKGVREARGSQTDGRRPG